MNQRPNERAGIAAAAAAIDPDRLGGERWFPGKGRVIEGVTLVHAFALDPRSVLAVVEVAFTDRSHRRVTIPFVSHEATTSWRTAEPGDGVWAALALATLEGRVVPAIGPVEAGDAGGARIGDAAAPGTAAALVCRPAGRLRELLSRADRVPTGPPVERPLGVDQSNTSVVLDERVVLKAFRRVEEGLEPDLELTAFLSEEAPFGAVPALAGSIELAAADDGVATIALLSEYVPDAVDGYESTAEALTAWLVAPGQVAVEYASEDAADLGLLTAALHAALGSRPEIEGFEVRPATRDELRAWHATAMAGLERAAEVTVGAARDRLRAAAPEIAARLSVHEAHATAPVVSRIHGDLHLGQVMRAEDGWRIIDFEGEPTRSLAERRAHASPLRDVASMLRSLHHVGLSAARRAEARSIERGSGPLVSTGLDLDGWQRRSRERFIDAYRHGLRRAGATGLDVDDDLLLAFELEKAVYEFVYAATYLPSWTEIALAGLEGLLAWTREADSPTKGAR